MFLIYTHTCTKSACLQIANKLCFYTNVSACLQACMHSCTYGLMDVQVCGSTYVCLEDKPASCGKVPVCVRMPASLQQARQGQGFGTIGFETLWIDLFFSKVLKIQKPHARSAFARFKKALLIIFLQKY